MDPTCCQHDVGMNGFQTRKVTTIFCVIFAFVYLIFKSEIRQQFWNLPPMHCNDWVQLRNLGRDNCTDFTSITSTRLWRPSIGNLPPVCVWHSITLRDTLCHSCSYCVKMSHSDMPSMTSSDECLHTSLCGSSVHFTSGEKERCKMGKPFIQ